MYDPYAELEKNVLPNGLEIHSVFWDRAWIYVEIVVHSGAREDSVAMPGVAHFVEHCVSNNIPGFEHEQARQFFEDIGGSVGFGITNYYSTRYRFTVPANPTLFQDALGIIGSMLLEAHIEKDTEREREVVLGEFKENYPFKEKLDWLMAQRRAIFKGHRLETYNRPIGFPDGFLSATEADLQRFYDEHYVPANMSLVCVGGLSTKDVISAIERSPFGKIKKGQRNPLPSNFTGIVLPEVKEMVVRASDYTSLKPTQIEYESSWAVPYSFPRQALRVFNSILWSVLFREIRQKRGLSYGFKNGHRSYQDIYEYYLTGKISISALSSVGERVRECISMVPFEREIFEKNLRSLIHRCQMVDVSGEDLSRNCGDELALYQRIIFQQEVLDNLREVKHEQMEEMAEFLSAEKQYTFMFCP